MAGHEIEPTPISAALHTVTDMVASAAWIEAPAAAPSQAPTCAPPREGVDEDADLN